MDESERNKTIGRGSKIEVRVSTAFCEQQKMNVIRKHVNTIIALLLMSVFLPNAKADNLADSYRVEIVPILQNYCFDCHSGQAKEGGISFAGLSDELSLRTNGKHWRKVREALSFGNMPPQDVTQPNPLDRQHLIKWIIEEIETPDPNNALFLDPGPPVLRQLSREEYKRTVQDLLGLGWQDPASQAGIPNERPAEGFANLAGSMTIDPSLLEKYFHAAEIALERLLNEGRERDQIFFAEPDETKGISAHDAAAQVLERFVNNAYRRPIDDAEWQRLLPIFDAAYAKEDDYRVALKKAMKPVLASPHFLYRIEQQPHAETPGQTFQRVSDHELAVRLSYFLWSSMPDRELRECADRGELRHPEVLTAQVTRMLTHDKARALTENFGTQWLKLGKLDRALPHQNFFPTYTGDLKRAMHDEVFTFFDHLRKENRSLRELIDSNYTFVNEVLAKHYGIAGVTGNQMQRVALQPDHHRGGLLGMAGLLTATSHTDRTKPTARGTWMLDVLFGTPPSPPPENAGALEDRTQDSNEDTPKPTTFREQLALHAKAEACAGCHKKMDPFGFALENYDAIGVWRTTVGNKPVDNWGVLPSGEVFHGVDELKAVIRKREDALIKNFIRQLLVYALGREAEFYDELAIARIAETTEPNGYRFADIAASIAISLPFQNQRVSFARP